MTIDRSHDYEENVNRCAVVLFKTFFFQFNFKLPVLLRSRRRERICSAGLIASFSFRAVQMRSFNSED